MAPEPSAHRARNRILFLAFTAGLALVAAVLSSTPRTKPWDAPAHEWVTPDGLRLPCRRWLPQNSPRGLVIAVHGLSGASSDFLPLATQLSAGGWAVFAPDQRSQGNDPDPRSKGDLRDWRQLPADLGHFVAGVRREHPAGPLVFYGESMGSLVVLSAIAHGEVPRPDGIVLASPVVVPKGEPKGWQEMVANALMFTAPGWRIRPEDFADRNAPKPRVTRNDEYEALLRDAPHLLREFTLRFFRELREMMRHANQSASGLSAPLLVLSAGQDIFVSADAVRDFFGRAASPKKTLREYPEAYHLLLHDPVGEDVVKHVCDWLESLEG